ncbi:MAG: TlpA family protein disulfide reductase, partial [Candidatus Dadabacteria bacterium]|nr:TlpA family protein disulfide reductase [Candidatus Dadabacteria bacterium]NIV42925.1 redoxin domain-containing protein [Candidatus Dadabacteria bacterium]NIX14889.1 redoxin domain-containing protein [Candidatus Dadabacteria bacterium]
MKNIRKAGIVVLLAMLNLLDYSAYAAAMNPFNLKDPLIGKKAPSLETEVWFNSSGLSLESLKGNVVVIEFFQLWCPGCNKFSIPLMNKWRDHTFSSESGVKFISVHTVFEGHEYQDNERLKYFLKEKGITHPVAVDKHIEGRNTPVTMTKYKTGGTPCIAIIDKKGIVRFKYFGGFK